MENMNLKRPSLRTSLGITILGMGLLGISLVYITSEAYQRFALNNQYDVFHERAKLKIDTAIEEIASDIEKMGLAMQSTAEFKQDFRSRSIASITAHLDEGFHRAFVTLNRVQLSKVYAFDKTLQTVAQSNEGHSDFFTLTAPCQDILTQAAQRTGPSRLKPITALCSNKQKPYIAALTPIGGLRLEGYLLLLADPVLKFIRTEESLASPVRIKLPNGDELARSSDWPGPTQEGILFSEYKLKTSNGTPYLNILFATGISELLQKLANTRRVIFITGIVSIVLIIIIALLAIQKTVITPINKLSTHLREIRGDKTNIGKQLAVIGGAEIAGLTTDFNNMTNELRTLYNTLENMAFSDELTTMANRTLFYNRLEHATLETKRYNTSFTIFMMDLDRFKNINDTLGHHIGDMVLQEIGRRLLLTIRESDTVARLGGDEFAFMFPSIDNDQQLKATADKILDALSIPVLVEGHSLSIGASIGIVHCPEHGTEPSLLMRRADIAMYQAKKTGEDIVFYQTEMDSQNLFELTIEAELNKALESDSFELYYQPKVDMDKRRITAVEALIRWQHPEKGLIEPEKFIPLAEQCRMIDPITKWVLNNALRQCAQWHEMGLAIGISVNLSAFSLKDSVLCEMVCEALQDSGLPAEHLTLELTESAIMTDTANALKILTQLDGMGVRLSVDDFGTGYSSLAYLKRLPVDEIKIDKSFVMDMIENSNDEVIVRSTIDLAHNMGMQVVAEGIENHQTWDKLSELQCDLGQGYYMSRPCTVNELNEWLQQTPWNRYAGQKG